MAEFPDPISLMTQSLNEARPEAALAGATAMAALLAALGQQEVATRFYVKGLELQDRIELAHAVKRLQAAISDVGLEERSFHNPLLGG